MESNDKSFMARALELAAKGRGKVEPNPMVGAVIVRGDTIIGEGYHRAFGEPHAEVEAIDAAGGVKGATMYVTLEPCNHEGKTPPCTEAIINSGISRVVYAMGDSDPEAGGGGKALKAAGIDVSGGLLEDGARALNAPFIKFTTSGLPYVTAKWAMTLDGKIATKTGDSKWISSDKARQHVHWMRSVSDAVLVGDGTVRADDPQLTSRIDGGRNPLRCVISPELDVPPECKLVATAGEVPTIFYTSDRAPGETRATLEAAGCRVVTVTEIDCSLNIEEILKHLAGLKVTNLLVEGGGETHGRFFDAGHVDRVACFISPKIIGGRDAATAVKGEGIALMGEAINVEMAPQEQFGDTVLLSGTLKSY